MQCHLGYEGGCDDGRRSVRLTRLRGTQAQSRCVPGCNPISETSQEISRLTAVCQLRKFDRNDIRNVAIIAHVDHGKTRLVDCMLRQSGRFRETQLVGEQILDSNDLERERGITILAKNIAIPYKGVKINIIDTPGHADFGGEVERVLRMADGALVLVDAAEGPMPQTRFVLSKAFECGLRPIVVINKIDRPDARPHEVVDEVLELFLQLGADDVLADFPYLFASAKLGYATSDPDQPTDNIQPLMDMILEKIPGPDVELDEPLQMLVTTLDWSDYVGRIAIGRVQSGTVRKGQSVVLMQNEGRITPTKVVSVHVFEDLGRVEVHEVDAGDICAIVGLEGVEIGDTVAAPQSPRALPRLKVDEPTLKMTFGVNTSPLAGREGKYVTSRHLRERLMRELERNVALRVEPIAGTEQFSVAGRGVLHLSILIETMRREGYELSVGKPQVIFREIDGKMHEPFESLVVEAPADRTGPVMELVGERRGQLVEMTTPQRIHVHDFFDSRPRTDRPADAAAERDAGHGRHSPPFRGLSADGRGDSRPLDRRVGVDCGGQGRGLRAGQPSAAGRTARCARRRGLRGHDRRRKQPARGYERQSDEGEEALEHAGRRPRPQHSAEAGPADVAGRGVGVHRRGRVGRGYADADPPAEDSSEGAGPPPRQPAGNFVTQESQLFFLGQYSGPIPHHGGLTDALENGKMERKGDYDDDDIVRSHYVRSSDHGRPGVHSRNAHSRLCDCRPSRQPRDGSRNLGGISRTGAGRHRSGPSVCRLVDARANHRRLGASHAFLMRHGNLQKSCRVVAASGIRKQPSRRGRPRSFAQRSDFFQGDCRESKRDHLRLGFRRNRRDSGTPHDQRGDIPSLGTPVPTIRLNGFRPYWKRSVPNWIAASS